ncbi:hypothetical protein Gotri_012481 [Gossypium trilobum]|uniref:Uncharacterized protein n=1 Tax=Gossypium trilobum TaxID=34281 RepID=A0A7J9DQF5_9ROSI|nr:hypothetical protein [Gossypium trilobum]
MRSSEFGLRKYSKRKVIFLRKGMCRSCGISLWTSTYSEPLPNSETLLIVVLLLEMWIWCLLWKSTRPCSVAQRFKLTRLILELLVSRRS